MGTALRLLVLCLTFGGARTDEKPVDFTLNDIMNLAGMMGLSESSAIHESKQTFAAESELLFKIAEYQMKTKGEDNMNKKPPPGPDGGSVKLDTTFSIDHVEALDEDEETMTVHGSVTLRWNDPRFVWKPEDYGHLQLISRSINEYQKSFCPWHPEVHFKTTEPGDIRKSDSGEGYATILSVNHKGDVVLHKKFSVKSSCDFNYRDFPYDTQRCQLMLTSHNSVKDVWFQYDRNQEKHSVRQLRRDGQSPMIGDFVLDWVHVLNAIVKNDLKPEHIKGPWKVGDPEQFKENKKIAVVVTLSFVRSNDKYFYSFSLPLFGLVVMTQGAMFFDTKKGFLVIGTSFLLLVCQMSLIGQLFPTDADGTPLLVVMHYLSIVHAIMCFGGLLLLTHFYGIREGLTTDRKPAPQHYLMTETNARITHFCVLAMLLSIIALGTFYFRAWTEWDGDQ